MYYRFEFEKAALDKRKTFSLVNVLLGEESRSGIKPDLNEDQAASEFSNFFNAKITKIRDTLDNDISSDSVFSTPNVTIKVGSALSEFSSLSQEEISILIRNAKKTSCPLDPIPTNLLLELLDLLLPVIHKIINSSLASGTVPTEFKKAIVKPLLKKASLDPDEFGNYRPVSNLPFISKILERAVADQLTLHLTRNGLQEKFQSAYRAGHSCETALLRIINDLLLMLDKGNTAVLVLLDLSAAFDTIDHELLLRRLSSDFGINQTAIDWFASYLSERTQRVAVGHSLSDESTLRYGVPQGSVLGPLLFSLYTCQLAKVIEQFKVNYHFFADDSQLYSCLPSQRQAALKAFENIEACCLAVKKWMTQNKLKQNDSKTEVLVCGPKQRRELLPRQSIKVGDSQIQFSEVVRTLGVLLDAELSMADHISNVTNICNYHIRRIGRARSCMTREVANSAAVALVLSKLDYCNSILHGVSKKKLKRLQLAQNSAARVVSKTKKRDHISPVLQELHWLPVEQRIEHKLLSLTYQTVDKTAPLYLSDIVPSYVPSKNLRSASKNLLQVPGKKEVRTKTYAEKAFSYAGPLAWNAIPLRLKNSSSKSSFKASLKTHLFKQAGT
jgi:hypothetical protein